MCVRVFDKAWVKMQNDFYKRDFRLDNKSSSSCSRLLLFLFLPFFIYFITSSCLPSHVWQLQAHNFFSRSLLATSCIQYEKKMWKGTENSGNNNKIMYEFFHSLFCYFVAVWTKGKRTCTYNQKVVKLRWQTQKYRKILLLNARHTRNIYTTFA